MTFEVSYIVLWAFVMFLFLLTIGVLGEVRRLRRIGVEVSRVPINSHAPTFSAVDFRTGKNVASKSFRGAEHTMLFVSPLCSVCHKLLQDLRGIQRSDIGELVIVCHGDAKDCAAFADLVTPDVLVLLDPLGEIAQEFEALKTPTSVLVNKGRIRGYGKPRTAVEIIELRESAKLHTATSSSALNVSS